ncbi:MAG: TonB-dependent receptor [Chthoniobacterales bacterium]
MMDRPLLSMETTNQRTRLHAALLGGALVCAAWFPLGAQEAVVDRIVVEDNRLPDAESAAPFSIHVIDAEELRRAPQSRLDDILRARVPGFSLFRRNSSRTANPTTQGVTLRNFAPSGAGRTLVLLDGIPLNDPFAGYVLWNQVPPAAVSSILVQPGGGAGVFGNAALAGTVFLVTNPLSTTSASLEGTVGNQDTHETSVAGTIVQQPVALAFFAEWFSTGGYPVIAADRRGPVDTNARSDSSLLSAQSEWQLGPETTLRLQARRFEDERGNGTRLTNNATTGEDVSAVLTQKFPAQQSELQLSAYGQRRRFRSTFSSVNAVRTIETPALDQFRVPAEAVGGSAVWSRAAGDHRLVLGGDARSVEGETHEAFFWDGTTFRRRRDAGGAQIFAGVFAEDTWSVTSNTTIVGGLRYDHWELFDGFRREKERATGAVLTNTCFLDRDGDEINGRLGARVQANEAFSVRSAFYSGFRVPTLNELYRPFRVGNDVTEANAALKPEHLLGGELAVEWQATPTFRISGTGFLNRLENAVSNVTIGVGPGPGGVLRQRQNVDLVLAPGLEATAEWQPLPEVRVRGSYLFTQPTIERAADPALIGKLLAQTPEHVFTGGVEWTPAARWFLSAQVRASDRQFEDDQNSRVLAAFATVDAAVRYEFSSRGSAALRVENLFDTEIESGRSADGIVSLGAPRLVSLQVRWQL